MGNWSQQKFNSDWTMEEFIECRLGKSCMEKSSHLRKPGKASRRSGKMPSKGGCEWFQTMVDNRFFYKPKNIFDGFKLILEIK